MMKILQTMDQTAVTATKQDATVPAATTTTKAAGTVTTTTKAAGTVTTTTKAAGTVTTTTKAVADGKKKEIEGDIAKSLGVAASDVTILSIKEVDARRRRLLAKKLIIEYEVKAKDGAAADALKSKMKSSTFANSIKTKVSATTGKTISVVAKEPKVADAPATATTAAPGKKAVVSA